MHFKICWWTGMLRATSNKVDISFHVNRWWQYRKKIVVHVMISSSSMSSLLRVDYLYRFVVDLCMSCTEFLRISSTNEVICQTADRLAVGGDGALLRFGYLGPANWSFREFSKRLEEESWYNEFQSMKQGLDHVGWQPAAMLLDTESTFLVVSSLDDE